jgi:hypothetical protein
VFWKRDKPEVTRPTGIIEGQRVKLALAGMKGVDARVEQLGDSFAVLGLFREPERPLATIGAAEAELEASTERGILRVRATVRQHNGQRDGVRVDFLSGGEIVQRRDFFRMDLMTPVVLSRANGTQVETHTLDLSASGCMLPALPEVRLHDSVHVAVDVGEDTPVRVRASVTRITDANHIGLRFESIPEAVRDRLIRYLFRRQRSASRVARR